MAAWSYRITKPFVVRLEARPMGLTIKADGQATTLPWQDGHELDIDIKAAAHGPMFVTVAGDGAEATRCGVATPATIHVTTRSTDRGRPAIVAMPQGTLSITGEWEDADEPSTTSWGWTGGFTW